MAIQFLCPFGHRLKVPDHRAGKKGRCPTCQQRVIVPVPNPIPSGREKRDWDASPGDRIELDDHKPTPPDEPDEDPFIEELLGHVAAAPERPEPAESKSAPPVPMASEAEASRPVFSELELALDAEDSESEHVSLAPPLFSVRPTPPAPSLATEPPAPLPSVPPPLPPPLPSAAGTTIASAPSIDDPPPVVTAAAGLGRGSQGKSIWIARARPELIEHAYRADAQQVENAYWLAVVLLFVIVFSAAPALGYLRLDLAPRWAQVMLLVGGMQLAYSIWLMIVPDWTTIRVGLWLFGASAVLYAAGAALFGMPAGPPPLGLSAARSSAAGWCGANALALGLLSYACGQVGATWRRVDFVAWSTSRRTM